MNQIHMDETGKVMSLRTRGGARRRISVATILALSFGALVLVSVGSVLALTVGANYRNTFDLVGRRASLLVGAMEDSLRAKMGRAEDAVTGLAKLYEAGGFEIDDQGTMKAALSGALSSVPDASGILIIDRQSNRRGVIRKSGPDGNQAESFEVVQKGPVTNTDILQRLRELPGAQRLQWGDFVPNEGRLYANVAAPLIRQGDIRGWIVAPIELLTLSRIAQDLSRRFETTAFILDGGDRVLAHERLLTHDFSEGEATIPLASFDDPVLAHFMQRRPISEFSNLGAEGVQIAEIDTAGGPNAGAEQTDPHGYIVITKRITGYAVRPWTIGAYFPKWEVGQEIMRTWVSAAIGLALLAIALVVAVILGRFLSRPVKAIAAQAHLVADFDLDSVRPLSHSRVLEFDNQASAFNAMLTGLRAFSAYVPRSLVAKLVRTGEADATKPRESTLTVMFTDITGFTSLSEQLPASAGAELLNHHFALLCAAIDKEGGTVDKFLGDGVMAFFGAPDRLEGHAAAAVRATIAIRAALEEDNKAAVQKGLPPLRIRVGIHTGKVIVGDIGGSDRVNYTIVGDTVNVSQRLQELGKVLAPDAEVAIMISGETAARLDNGFQLTPSGKHRLRGRGEPVEVFLVGELANVNPLERPVPLDLGTQA